jgi:hypothetical protein
MSNLGDFFTEEQLKKLNYERPTDKPVNTDNQEPTQCNNPK